MFVPEIDLDKIPKTDTLYEYFDVRRLPFLKETSINLLKLSPRLQNIVSRYDLLTIDALFSQRYDWLCNMRNLGRVAMMDLLQACKKFIEDSLPLIMSGNDLQTNVLKETKGNENDLLPALIVEFTQLNRAGQEALLETARAFAAYDKYHA